MCQAMSKRTRDMKINAHHNFAYSWSGNGLTKTSVNRQRVESGNLNLAKTSVKKEVVRSLIIASLILATEMVIYLAR